MDFAPITTGTSTDDTSDSSRSSAANNTRKTASS